MADDTNPNQSPETMDDSDDDDAIEEIDLDDLIQERVQAILGGGTSGKAPAASTPKGPEPHSAPAVAPVAAGGSGPSVADEVRRVLGEKEQADRLAAVEEKVNAPSTPKPRRGLVATFLFGDRDE